MKSQLRFLFFKKSYRSGLGLIGFRRGGETFNLYYFGVKYLVGIRVATGTLAEFERKHGVRALKEL